MRRRVLKALRRAIVQGVFPPGAALPERKLRAMLGTAPHFIDEALRQLAAEGLVQIVPGKGAVVRLIDGDEARQIDEVRGALTALAARRLAERGGERRIAGLEAALDRLERASDAGDWPAGAAAAARFYRVFFERAGNPVLNELIQSLNGRVHPLRLAAPPAPGRARAALGELRRILAAVRLGNGEQAAREAADHVRRGGGGALGLKRPAD